MCNNTAANVTVTVLLLICLQRSQDGELVADKLRLFSERDEREEQKIIYVFFYLFSFSNSLI